MLDFIEMEMSRVNREKANYTVNVAVLHSATY